MGYPSISKPATELFGDTRAQASRWGGQLGQLFGWLIALEFGLMSVALGLVVVNWPDTPEFVVSAAGAWLLLLAGSRGLTALVRVTPIATAPPSSPRMRKDLGAYNPPYEARSFFSPRAVAQPGAPGSQARMPGGPARYSDRAVPGPFRLPAVRAVPAAPGSAGRKTALVQVASLAGTGYVLLHAEWPSRSTAVPLALAFAAVVVMVCAGLDVLVARFSGERDPSHRLIRGGVWMGAALLLLALIRADGSAGLATSAVLIGLAETGVGGWMLNNAMRARRDRAEDAPALSRADRDPVKPEHRTARELPTVEDDQPHLLDRLFPETELA